MDFIQPNALLELVEQGGDRISIVKYRETAANGGITVEVCDFFNEESQFFETISTSNLLRRGIKKRSLRPCVPAELSGLNEVIKGQLIEAKRPYGYALCVVQDVQKDGTVSVKHRQEQVQTYLKRNLRRHLKFRRHKAEWVDRSFMSVN